MCLLFYCQRSHEEFPFILLANRDEFYDRPARPADFWHDSPAVLAGRDLRRGGTWLGITRGGRWAALTNYREPSNAAFERSRGDILRDYLTGTQSARRFAEGIARIEREFDGFNLLFGDSRESLWLSNRSEGIHTLEAGIYGLSNHLLETPWPKVVNGKRNIAAQLEGEIVTDRLFQPLIDRTDYEEDLPDTGMERETERMLSSAFITGARYGTRSSTLIMANRDGEVYFEERTYDNRSDAANRSDEYASRTFQFSLTGQAPGSNDSQNA